MSGMKEKMIKVNDLPSPTWNHLGVNAAYFPDGVLQNVSPVTPGPQFDNIETSAGEEIKKFTLDNCNSFELVKADGDAGVFCKKHDIEDALCDVTLIDAEKDSKVTVFRSYISDKPVYHSGLTLIRAGENSDVTLVQVQLVADGGRHISSVGVTQEKESKVRVVQIELGASAAFAGALSDLCGDGSRFECGTFYFGDGVRRTDLNYIARHRGRATSCEMKAAGALLGKADKVYRGTIDFKRGCAGSVGHESEETLLFGEKARNRTVPLILCEEEDVEGNHAATIGKIDKNRLFYMQSRGISEREIKKLAVTAQIIPLLSEIPDEECKGRIRNYLDGRITLD